MDVCKLCQAAPPRQPSPCQQSLTLTLGKAISGLLMTQTALSHGQTEQEGAQNRLLARRAEVLVIMRLQVCLHFIMANHRH